MNDQTQYAHRTFSLLNTLLIPVFILFLIGILNLTFLVWAHSILIPVLTACLTIYGMSALAGGILEALTGEDLVFRIRRLHEYAMDMIPGFLVAFAAIGLVDFFIFTLLPSLRVWRAVYFGFLELLAVFMVAQWAIIRKYTAPLGLPPGRFKFTLNFTSVLILAYLAQLLVAWAVSHIHIRGFQAQNISLFMDNYIHVFEFILCSIGILDSYPEVYKKFNSQKEVFLINPMGAKVIDSLAFLAVNRYPPVFVVLKSLSPKTYRFHEFNGAIWHERYYKSNALVCITCFTSNSYEAYKIAKEFKKRGSKVIMGGPHVSCLPQEALAFCDSVVVGQAEGVWGQVLRDHEAGELKAQYKGPATEEDYAQVQKELLISPPYVVKEFLETTRGCKFRCHFCTVPALSGGQLHLASINDFIELIKRIKPHHYRNITLIDSNIYADPAYSRELFTALIPLKIKWHSQCTIDIAKNEETLKLARESGCSGLLVGYEISGGSLEKNQGGKFAMAQKYLEYTNIIKKAGIKIKGQFIYGFDTDDLKSLFSLWRFCFSVMPLFTAISLLTPLPGSGLYRDMLNQDRIINLNWRSYGFFKMVLRHPHINPVLISFFFPFLVAFFFLTTSSFGLMITAIYFINFSLFSLHQWGILF